jgi:hypothetical protein
MKKLLVLLLVAIAAGWWQFVGVRQTITEDDVRQFYAMSDHAIGMRDPSLHCALLDSKFHSEGYVTVGEKRERVAQNKKQTCEGYASLYALWADVGESMDNSLLQLDWNNTINSITISSDGKTATVDYSNALDVGGSLMHIKGHSTDTLIRKSGKVLMLRSEGEGSVSSRIVATEKADRKAEVAQGAVRAFLDWLLG